MRERRILIISGIFPPDPGGPASYVPTVASALVKAGWNVTVLTLADDPTEPVAYPFRVVRLARKRNPFVRALLVLREIVRLGSEVDLVYVNGLYTHSCVGAHLIRKPTVVKYVGDPAWERVSGWGWFTDTIDVFQSRRGSPGVGLIKLLRAMTARSFGGVITPSDYLASIVSGWGVPRSSIRVIRNAVPDLAIRSRKESVSGRVAIIGRLIPHKRVGQSLAAILSIPGTSCDVIGGGPLEHDLKREFSDAVVNGRVVFHGNLPRARALQVLGDCDVMVLNSTYEGLPHVVLESIALGVPVVATDVGGTSEALKHEITGYLVPREWTDELTSRVAEAFDLSSLPRFREGQEEILERYGLGRMIDDTLACLDRGVRIEKVS